MQLSFMQLLEQWEDVGSMLGKLHLICGPGPEDILNVSFVCKQKIKNSTDRFTELYTWSLVEANYHLSWTSIFSISNDLSNYPCISFFSETSLSSVIICSMFADITAINLASTISKYSKGLYFLMGRCSELNTLGGLRWIVCSVILSWMGKGNSNF